ncbi:SdrD B-like domain-containing protein [Chloroflexota bacterium]
MKTGLITSPPTANSPLRRLPVIFVPVIIAVLGIILFFQLLTARADATLTVTIDSSYNLVVDSNSTSPSTYAPSVATVMGEICNSGDVALTNVVANIGDYVDGTPANDTPGVYPVRTVDAAFQIEHPWQTDLGINYSFTHLGGDIGLADASRLITHTLAPGQCFVQYWHFTYPHCEDNESPPCSEDVVWGDTNVPDDDLWLEYDIWATSAEGATAYATRKMTMRNEISAMANKIEPNPNGRWFNTNTSTVSANDVITSNGVLYTFGVVNKGFDNDGDFLYDYNAWMQPVGDPAYDPSCFRLIRTTGRLTVSRSSMPDLVIPFTNQLYFTNLPDNNTGVVGIVHYTFKALGGSCTVGLSPYQEAASGADNEKFNADFGEGVPPLSSYAPLVEVTKSSDPDTVSTGSVYTYTIPFVNNDPDNDAGLMLSSGWGVYMPLVISDTIPAGMEFVSAGYSLGYTPNSGVIIRYSTDNGTTYTTTVPAAPGDVDIVQWWLNDPLPQDGGSGSARLTVQVPGTYTGTSFIENTACAQFDSAANLDCGSTVTIISGNNSIGDFVWADEDNDTVQPPTDTLESGISGVLVTLYYDADGDGSLNTENDLLYLTTTTDASGFYTFTKVPDGNYIVVVDEDDTDITNNYPGYRHTTAVEQSVALDPTSATSSPVDYDNADFGFGPSLKLKKSISGGSGYEGNILSYNITIQNLRPGGGEPVGNFCRYTTWATNEDVRTSSLGSTKRWFDPQNGTAGKPDSSYAYSDYSNSVNKLAGTDFTLGTQDGAINKVEAIFSVYVDGILLDDAANIYLFFNDSQILSSNFTSAQLNAFGSGSANQGLITWDVTAAKTWSWSDFTGDLDLEIDTIKSAGVDGATVYLDAIGFYVTSDAECIATDSSDVFLTVPLTDTFDTTKLQFDSANPQESEVNATTGVITWADVGPIYPGSAETVVVNFLALAPTDTLTTTVSNIACSTGTQFADDRYANNDCDTATGTLYQTGVISGVVFSDVDGDGWQPNGSTTGYEVGTDEFIPEVTVNLYVCVGLPDNPTLTQDCVANGGSWYLSESQQTDQNGAYTFDNLPPDYYYVEIEQTSIPGTTTPTADPEDTNGLCSGSNPCDNMWQDPDDKLTDLNYLSGGESITNKNFGYSVPPALFGTIWQDYDGDGLRDTYDNGLDNTTAGITVTITDSNGVITTTQTDANGYYEFTGLFAGETYTISVDTSTLPSGATWTQTSDPDAIIDDEHTVTLSAGEISGSHDFGYHFSSGPYSIGNEVYTDWNGDGDRDIGEEGLQGITMTLYSSSGAVISTTVTDSNGSYTFTGLITGTYYVTADTAGLPSTWDDYQQTDDPDSSGVCSTSCDSQGAASVSAANPTEMDIDFGYEPTGFSAIGAEIGQLVWADLDGDGIKDDDEVGIPNQVVYLYEDTNNDDVLDEDDALVLTTTTNSAGYYSFTDLNAGNYWVSVSPTTTVSGNTYVLSTNNNPLHVELDTGESYNDANFGYYPTGAIGDLIWYDNDGDGTWDQDNESGIAGVTVWLYVDDGTTTGQYDSSDTLYATEQTDTNGYYTFTDVLSDTYIVLVNINSFPESASEYTQTGDPDSTSVPCSDSDPSPYDCNDQRAVELTVGQEIMTVDFGYQKEGSIGDYVWFDFNGDGIQDATEQGVGGVVITLTPPSGPSITTTTDSDGYYSFGGLPQGSGYTIDISIPSTYSVTFDADEGVSGAQNSSTTFDVDANGGITWGGSNACSSGCDNFGLDFGVRYDGSYSIAGTIFFDGGGSGDGLTDTYGSGPIADTPYMSITVYLWDSNGNRIGTALTDENGDYTFTSLITGTYTVSVNPNSPQLDGLDLTASPTAGQSYNSVTVNSTTPNVTNQDFGFFGAIDFGDLPDSYNTTLGNEGAGHTGGDLYLGSTGPDYESDGVPSTDATGDGADDGDGVVRVGDWTLGGTGYLRVEVTGDNGYLVAFYDWNNDGDFEDPGEIVDFGDVVSGTNNLSLSIASYNPAILLNARYRLYDKDELTYVASTGLATNGEVEDYQYPPNEPTAVTLESFSAGLAEEAQVQLVWKTILEINAIGYNIYRSTSLEGERTLVNDQMILPQYGSLGGNTYSLYDTQAAFGVTYYYWLEYTDISGRTVFGPVIFEQHGIYMPIISQ